VSSKSGKLKDLSTTMRLTLIAASLMSAILLVACQATAPGPSPLATDEISVTPLDAPVGADVPASAADTTPPRPKPRLGQETDVETAAKTDTPEDPAASEAEPVKPMSPEQMLCEKTGGQWALAGTTGANICIKPTRDGGKLCRKKSDCEGLCLARSGTCAPFTPLFGCNEVLEKDGRRVTLCID
jgi:hypothetical protein